MIRPTTRNIVLHGVSLLLMSLLVLLAPEMRMMWLLVIGVLLLASLLDVVLVYVQRAPTLSLHLPERSYLGASNHATATVGNPSDWGGQEGTIVLDFEGAIRRLSPTVWQTLEGQDATVDIPLYAWRRGDAIVNKLALRYDSPLGLFERRIKIPFDGLRTTVVANLDDVQRMASHSSTLQSYLQGLKVIRHVGDGQAFDALRVFQPGHDSRAIDWSVSARMRELHVREFREERNHNVVLAFDTGRLMSRPIDDMPRLDIALNASLHLMYTALRLSDNVGLFGFDAQPRVWQTPLSGIEALSTVVDHAQRLPYTLNVTDFEGGLTVLSAHLKRRSMLFLLTDLEGDEDAQQLLRAAMRLKKRHLLYIFLLGNDTTPDALLDATSNTIPSILANAGIARARAATIRTLAAQGIHTVDTTHTTIVTDLLQAYADIKRRGLL